MTIARTIIIGALLATPIAILAAPVTPAPTPVVATASLKAPAKLICREIEHLGSLIEKQRICVTAEQWKEYEFRAGQWTERMSSQRWLYGGG